jgi:hypothetical protein
MLDPLSKDSNFQTGDSVIDSGDILKPVVPGYEIKLACILDVAIRGCDQGQERVRFAKTNHKITISLNGSMVIKSAQQAGKDLVVVIIYG